MSFLSIVIVLSYIVLILFYFCDNPKAKKMAKLGLMILTVFVLTPIIVLVLFFLTCLTLAGIGSIL